MRRLSILLGIAFVSGLPGLVLAAEEGGHHGGAPNWGLLGLAVLNVVILAFALTRFTRQPIRSFLFQRRETIRRALHDAEAKLAAAQMEISGLQARLKNLDRETREIQEMTQQQVASERERMAQRANETAERIRQDAERVSAREIERARQALREEAATLATKMAAELLRSHLNASDDRRLAEEFVQRVNGGAA